MHDDDIGLAESHGDKIAEYALDQAREGVVIGVDRAVCGSAEGVAGGAVVERGSDRTRSARRDALADFLDD